jgi:hypothetical protein
VLITCYVYTVLGVLVILVALTNDSLFQAWSEVEYPLLHAVFSENLVRWYVVASGVGLIG